MKPLSVLILAAGEGTRMKSDLPKVLHEAAGKPLLAHVLDAAAPLGGAAGVVLGRGADQVKNALADRAGMFFFIQKQRRGSGDAVKPAARWLARRKGDVMVLCGDAPLIRTETLKELLKRHRREGNAATLLTAVVKNPTGYGRIRRGALGVPEAIVEERDATEAERTIDEINSGTYVFRAADLLRSLAKLRPNNAKGEYYITDVVADLARQGRPIGALKAAAEEGLGVNNRRELSEAGALIRRRALARLMDQGVSVLDPSSTYVDADVKVGRDTVLFPQTFLRKGTTVGKNCRIGPSSWIEGCAVGDDAEIRASFAYNAQIGRGAKVGPFAHLRERTVIGPEARVGNFVETKKTRVGAGAKVSHLTYLGDASLGADVNVGAGVITCNYDGFSKHPTQIGAGAFVGSNVNLVAPVRVGAGAIVGAGSTITRDVPAQSLALERAHAVVKKGWAKQKRAELAKKRRGKTP